MIMLQLMEWDYTPTEWQQHVSMTVLIMEYKYVLPDNRNWQKRVSHDGPAHVMGIPTI